MRKIRIKVVKLGYQKNNMIIEKLKQYKSEIFEVSLFEQTLSNCDMGWGYSFDKLRGFLSTNFNEAEYDMCIGLIDTEIELNYFGKRLSGDNIYVISFYEIAEVLSENNIDVFNYLLSTFYRYITRYILKGEPLSHDETRSCMFDMCGNKRDIVYCSSQPIICESCEARIRSKQLPDDYLNLLKREIKKIRKSTYYRITDFIKNHPYLSILIVAISNILFGIIGDFIYDLMKCALHLI